MSCITRTKTQILILILINILNKTAYADETDFDRLVLKRNETDKVFLECHLTAEGHKVRNATVGRVIIVAKILQKTEER